MGRKIRSRTLFDDRWIKVTKTGVKVPGQGLLVGASTYGFDEIDVVLMRGDSLLSVQIGDRVHAVPVGPSHVPLIEELVAGCRASRSGTWRRERRMGTIQLRVWDVSGSRYRDVEAPDDVALERLLVLLVERMGLPIAAPDGQIMSYKLHHRASGRQLLSEQRSPSASAGGRRCASPAPEITAGS